MVLPHLSAAAEDGTKFLKEEAKDNSPGGGNVEAKLGGEMHGVCSDIASCLWLIDI